MNFLFKPNGSTLPAPGFQRLLNLADDLVETAAKAKYSGGLALCGIDSDFLTRLRVKVLQATLNPTQEYGLLTEVAAMCLQIQLKADSLVGQNHPAEIISDFKITKA